MNQKYFRIKQDVGVKTLFLADWLIWILTSTTLIAFFVHACFPEPTEPTVTKEALYIFFGLISAALTTVANLFSGYLRNVWIKFFGEK